MMKLVKTITKNSTLPFLSIILLLVLLLSWEIKIVNAKPSINIAAPDWAKKVVWYQIFPERFFNGDPNNDPKVEDQLGAWPHDHTSPWEIHPWTSDWYELQDYEKKNQKDIWFNLQRRRYGGDIQGIIDKLDYLQELGITAIYLNPIFQSPSLHKYDGMTYHHVDPNFGPDPDGDRTLIAKEIPNDPKTWIWTAADKLFLDLIKKIHQRKMYIIIDGVFNHMSIRSWAFEDVKQNQQKSRFKNWFKIKSWDNPEKKTKFNYKGWFGVRELPELKQDKNGIVGGPKEYIFAATKRWMDPVGAGKTDLGIDGWRLDVAFCVAHPFWKDWRNHVKSINPEAYLTAEVIDPIEVLKPYLQGDEFDAVMNYNFGFACAEFFINKKKRIKTSEFDSLLYELREAFSPDVTYVMQNLFDSHDSNRLATHIVNKDKIKYRNWGKYHAISKGSTPGFNTRKPNSDEREIQKLMIIFQMTNLGAPMIYYGDEAGMWGANDPDCRKPMVWQEKQYDNEVYLPNGSKMENPDIVQFDTELYEHFKKLIKLRNENHALQLGDFKTLFADDKNEIFAFSRTYKDEKIIVILNNKTEIMNVSLRVDINGTFCDILNNETKYVSSKNQLDLKINNKWGCILKLQ